MTMMQTSAMSAFRTVAQTIHAGLIQRLFQFTQNAQVVRDEAAWDALEAAVLGHLRLEGELLLPDFGLAADSEAARIREEHEGIRQVVVVLSGACPDAPFEVGALTELRRRLQACAALEERTLYPWADLYLRRRKKGEFVQRSQQAGGMAGGRRAIRVAS